MEMRTRLAALSVGLLACTSVTNVYVSLDGGEADTSTAHDAAPGVDSATPDAGPDGAADTAPMLDAGPEAALDAARDSAPDTGPELDACVPVSPAAACGNMECGQAPNGCGGSVECGGLDGGCPGYSGCGVETPGVCVTCGRNNNYDGNCNQLYGTIGDVYAYQCQYVPSIKSNYVPPECKPYYTYTTFACCPKP